MCDSKVATGFSWRSSKSPSTHRLMVIFLTGATGFIGRHLASALRAAGHRVIEARRRVSDPALHVAADFTRDLNASDWIPRLANVDCVINAVGILRERGD